MTTALLAALPARAQDPVPVDPRTVERGRLRLLWENDSWLSSSDRFYTNGAGIGWTLPEGPTANAFASTLSGLPFRADTVSGTATELLVGQEIYTPEDTERADLIVDDRPYAGWLHLDVRHQILTLDAARDRDRQDTWLLQIGVVGPSSLAAETQIQIHQAVDAPQPQGWRHQLHDEPGIVLGFRRDLRTGYEANWWLGLEADCGGHYGIHLGNVDTSGSLGAELRLGWNLPRHFGSALRSGTADDRQRLYVAAGVDGRVVLRNIFLDGNTYRSSHRVSHNHLVANFHVGLFWEPCPWARLGVTSVFRTPEFDSPSSRDVTNFTAVEVEMFF